jgi:AraC-like DNA-binding protein
MDVLSDVLSAVTMSGAFFFHATNYAPWVCGEPAAPEIGRRLMPDADVVVAFHIVMAGGCWVESIGDEPGHIRMEEGDIVVFPKGDAHFMMSAPGMRRIIDPAEFDPPPGRRQPLSYTVNGESGGPIDCSFICGFMGCKSRPFNPLLDALPRMFRTRSSEQSRQMLASLAEAGVAESERDGAGGSTMLAKLADLMFVEVLRQQIDLLTDDSRGWLSGLRDRHVGEALRLLHEDPAADWTLELLAQQVGLSRSTFAERFVEYVGIPAIQYLAQWRMTLASRLLEDPDVSLAQAGAQVGYESEAAFQRAFKKHVGVAPGAWRKERRVAIAAE